MTGTFTYHCLYFKLHLDVPTRSKREGFLDSVGVTAHDWCEKTEYIYPVL